ncbi:MAG: hypothetical protein ACRDNJ_00285 [Solirubrobacteraceae bacterium]
MKSSSVLAAGVAGAALLLLSPAASLAASPTTVSVRVEGLNNTLLPATRVRTQRGSITKGGAPRGACPATNAAGALDAATHDDWTGSYDSFGLSVVSILGESHPFSSSDYWSVFVNGHFASAGICDLRLARGEQLLFAAVPQRGTEYPLAISAPRHAGHRFTVTVTAYRARGAARPIAGASVTDGGVTNRHGRTTVRVPRSGRVTLTASRRGHIRAETTVRVR